MKPLQPIALGLVVVALEVPLHGVDLLANPLGWLLVLLGVRDLPDLDRGAVAALLARVAAVVSVPLWVPVVAHAVDDAEPALAWALGLPAIAFAGLLCHGLARAAAVAHDRLPTALLRLGVTANLVVASLPVVVFGAGADGLSDVASAVAGLTVLAVVALCFLYSDRAWARPEPTGQSAAKTPAGP